jgi:tripartite-type tricarboxylate transporter receptor subunit TctC
MMIKKKAFMVILIFTVVALSGWILLPNADAAPYYKGKNITVLVGFNAGGGTDTAARLFTKHFSKYIPGNPSVIVKNLPGGGGIKATNLIAEKTRPDGLTIIFQNWVPIAQLIEESGVRFDYTKLTPIGAMQGPPLNLFARVDAVAGGIKEAADIVKAEKLVYAGLRPSVSLDIFGRFSLDLLGVKYRYVAGYRGAAKVRAAIQQGQANITTHAITGYRSGVEPTLVKDGTVTPLWYFQKKDHKGNYLNSPDIPDMPPFMDVYKKVHGKAPSGKLWNAFDKVQDLWATVDWFFWGPPKMNKEATEALRKGFDKLIVDPALIADMKKIIGFVYKPVSLDAAQNVLDELENFDPETIEFVKRFIASGVKK